MPAVLVNDGGYWINDIDRGRKRFSPHVYFQIDNWYWDFKNKRGNEPTFVEMQQMCAKRSIAGFVDGHTTTFPDESMRSIYRRLVKTVDPVLIASGITSGKCAPLPVYLRERVFYMSVSADEGFKTKLEEKRKDLKLNKV